VPLARPRLWPGGTPYAVRTYLCAPECPGRFQGRIGIRVTEWSYSVKIWAIRKRSDSRNPYQLRWKVGPRPHSESFLTLGLAESRRAQLITAAREGEPFDVD